MPPERTLSSIHVGRRRDSHRWSQHCMTTAAKHEIGKSGRQSRTAFTAEEIWAYQSLVRRTTKHRSPHTRHAKQRNMTDVQQIRCWLNRVSFKNNSVFIFGMSRLNKFDNTVDVDRIGAIIWPTTRRRGWKPAASHRWQITASQSGASAQFRYLRRLSPAAPMRGRRSGIGRGL